MKKRPYTFKDTLYTCFIGYIVQAIVVNLVPLFFVVFQKEFRISFEQIGRLVLLNFSTQILTDLLSVRWADRLGTRRCLVLAHLCYLCSRRRFNRGSRQPNCRIPAK